MSQKEIYSPTEISTKTNGDLSVKLVYDKRCNPPYLVYGFYTKVSESGAKLRSQDLLWWWGSNEQDGLGMLNKLLKKETQPDEQRGKRKPTKQRK